MDYLEFKEKMKSTSKYDVKVEDTESIDSCPFCTLISNEKYIWAGKYFVILPNVYPYNQHYEKQNHIMIVSKSHIHLHTEFSQRKKAEFNKIKESLIDIYYDLFDSYLILERGNTSSQSIYHMHTHIIERDDFLKTGIQERKFIGYKESMDSRLIERIKNLECKS
jgi:diadenosine tetraphosphate (Ap4A) HIT family hydrolase